MNIKCAGTTHILRLNWSPDANCVVSAHAMNNGMPTAQIIERNGWKTKLDFVGHEKAVTVVVSFKFSNHSFTTLIKIIKNKQVINQV